MRIVFTGGGTGGHFFPLIAIIRELRKLSFQKNLEFYYLGPHHDWGFILLSQEEVIVKKIIAGKIRRYFDWQNIIDVFKIIIGFFHSLYWLIKIKPKLVFSKGGEGSICVTMAAGVLGIPVFIHESDIVPGLSNRKTAKWAKKIFVSFPQTEYFDPERIILTGNPIRKEILGGSIEKAQEIFNLTLSKPVLLVTGGSQGSQAINDFILLILNDLLRDWEVIHVAGMSNIEEVKTESAVTIENDFKKYYHLLPFLDEKEMKHALAAADLVVSRAGSGSIFEIAACGKPSILIPLPGSAGEHQAKNAYFYSQVGACLVFEQENLKPNFFLDNLKLLLFKPEKLEEMSKAALEFSKPLAAGQIAREILEYLMIDYSQ